MNLQKTNTSVNKEITSIILNICEDGLNTTKSIGYHHATPIKNGFDRSNFQFDYEFEVEYDCESGKKESPRSKPEA